VPLHRAALGGDVCLAFGHEDRGCSPGLLAAADQIAYIPQVGRVGSLNVAAATAIALAEARRREWESADPPGAPREALSLPGGRPPGAPRKTEKDDRADQFS
jgi:tRNA (guanosine-2'-O-)-methyltransferase